MIIIESKRKKQETLLRQYPDARIIDVTSHATDEFQRFSPFYPHGGIPVPNSPGFVSRCVEGVWQGLKVFETCGTDCSMFRNDTMKNIKRTTRRFGKCLGHRKGVTIPTLLSYIDARREIYLPTYRWMLENRCQEQIKKIRIISKSKTVILLDYDINPDVWDPSKPLSHASLIKAYIEGNYPE